MPTNLHFHFVEAVTHAGTVLVFGESRGESEDARDGPHKLWYQLAVDEGDEVRRSEWTETPLPGGGARRGHPADPAVEAGGRPGERGGVLAGAERRHPRLPVPGARGGGRRVYGNRYRLLSDEATGARLEAVSEAALELSTVTPEDGRFTVALAGRRWQLVWKAEGSALTALSAIRDEDVWLRPEAEPAARTFVVHRRGSGDPLELVGRPDSLVLRGQEVGDPTDGNEPTPDPGRLLLAARFQVGAGPARLVVLDFALDDDGVAEIPEKVVLDDAAEPVPAALAHLELDDPRLLHSSDGLVHLYSAVLHPAAGSGVLHMDPSHLGIRHHREAAEDTASEDRVPAPELVALQLDARRPREGGGGWVEAPESAARRFGPRADGPPVAATVALPGHVSDAAGFTVEAWVRPDRIPLREQRPGTAGESRLITLRGDEVSCTACVLTLEAHGRNLFVRDVSFSGHGRNLFVRDVSFSGHGRNLFVRDRGFSGHGRNLFVRDVKGSVLPASWIAGFGSAGGCHTLKSTSGRRDSATCRRRPGCRSGRSRS